MSFTERMELLLEEYLYEPTTNEIVAEIQHMYFNIKRFYESNGYDTKGEISCRLDTSLGDFILYQYEQDVPLRYNKKIF